jgi:hypothetical protein
MVRSSSKEQWTVTRANQPHQQGVIDDEFAEKKHSAKLQPDPVARRVFRTILISK